MIVVHCNHRQLLFAIIFIAINVIILPLRIKSGFGYPRLHDATGPDATPYANGIINVATDWVDSYSPRHLNEQNTRISFKLHDPKDVPRPDKFLSVSSFFCKDREDLPPSLGPSDGGRLFDFTTTVSTNLNVLFMGDSLAHQFSQGFEAAVLGDGREKSRHVHMKYVVKGKQFDCLVTSAPIRGGGSTAFWRYTKLLERNRWAKIMPCYTQERKWGENFLHQLLNHKYTDPEGNRSVYSINGFDAVVVRLPHGWMKAEELTRERINEVVTFCQELLGARVVILTTVGLDNNAITSDMWEGVLKINELIHDVANNWEPPATGYKAGVQWVLVQEFSHFTSQILYENGKHIGYNVSSNAFFFERLKDGATSWAQSIPMVCSNKPKDDLDSNCKRNKISPDGIHWCVETLGPRYTAAIACLLGCVYNGRQPETTKKGSNDLRKCESDCNKQFMSLMPVDERLIERGQSLFASSDSCSNLP